MALETAPDHGQEPTIAERYRYCVYGIAVASDIPLALPEYSDGGLGDVEFFSASPSLFRRAMQGVDVDPRSDSWYRYAALPDGSSYVQWDAIGEFLVAADGRRIRYRRADGSSAESFQVYMLGQALSFALVQQGLEPLHATAVVVDDRAIAFLGTNASGKSSLAAYFLSAGDRLLTDDLLLLRRSANQIVAYPGPARIKLFPTIGRRLLGEMVNGVQMNADTNKLIVPLDERSTCGRPVALDAIYSLAVPRDSCRSATVRIETLSPRDAFVELVRSTFNRRIAGAGRLARQFRAMTNLTEATSVKILAYPRAIDWLREVRRTVLIDLERDGGEMDAAPKFEPSVLL